MKCIFDCRSQWYIIHLIALCIYIYFRQSFKIENHVYEKKNLRKYEAASGRLQKSEFLERIKSAFGHKHLVELANPLVRNCKKNSTIN